MEKYRLLDVIPDSGFYVYELIDTRLGTTFYVGKGSGNRCLDHFIYRDNNRLKHSIIDKILDLGMVVDIKIPFTTNIEEKALFYETDLISKHGRRNLNKGTLTNLTDGGEGVSGCIFSDERRLSISHRVRGKSNPMFGRTRTDEEKQQISETRKRKTALGLIPRRKHSEESKRHISECSKRYGKETSERFSKAILQIDPNTGEVLREWKSLSEAKCALGTSVQNIGAAINTTNTMLVKGYLWRFKGDPNVVDGKLITISEILEYRNREIPSKRVYQIDKTTKAIIKEWKSIHEIYKTLGINSGTLSKMCNRKGNDKTAGGYLWRFTTDCEFKHSSVSSDSSCHASPEQP